MNLQKTAHRRSSQGWATAMLLACLHLSHGATDITTLSGKKYFDVHDVQVRGDVLSFTTDTEIVKIPLSDIPPALKSRYLAKSTPTPPPAAAASQSESVARTPVAASSAHDLVVNTGNRYLSQMADDLQATKTSPPAMYSAASAFTVNDLDTVRTDALSKGRAVAFFIVDAPLLALPCTAREAGRQGALAHFFQTFAKSTTIVFIFPERDLAALPTVLTAPLGKPVPVTAPRVIFTNSAITEVLHDLTLTSEALTPAQRDEAIYPAVGMIKRWYVRVANSVP